MALSIKTGEADRLARELARLTPQSGAAVLTGEVGDIWVRDPHLAK